MTCQRATETWACGRPGVEQCHCQGKPCLCATHSHTDEQDGLITLMNGRTMLLSEYLKERGAILA